MPPHGRSPFAWLPATGRQILGGLIDLLYPPACFLCTRDLADPEQKICTTCTAHLVGDPAAACPRCAATIGPFANVAGGCHVCRDLALAFTQAIRLGPYQGLLREKVLAMKHSSGQTLARVLGAFWTEQTEDLLRGLGAELVVPIPLHWRRWFKRGYNQSEVLARAVAHRLRIPCRPRLLRRIRHTPFQSLQPASSRRDNVRGAFVVRRVTDVRDRTILLIDDVMTTGWTCSEAARVLLAAGARNVVVAVLARAHDGLAGPASGDHTVPGSPNVPKTSPAP